MIKIEDFITHIKKNEAPLAQWSDLIQSLWWVKKGSWEKAHNLAQEIESSNGSWVHAYLHRIEGDLGNAGYWYRRAGKKPLTNESLDAEWAEITEYLLVHL